MPGIRDQGPGGGQPAVKPSSRPAVWPDPRLATVLAWRALLVWGMLRSALALVAWLHDGMMAPPGFGITPWAAAWLVAVVTALMLLDLRRRGELVLHANLGIGPAALAAVASLPPLLAELVVAGVAAA